MSNGWFKVDNGVAERSREVGPSALMVYAAIARHADNQRRAWPGIDRLSAMTGLSAMDSSRHCKTRIRRMASCRAIFRPSECLHSPTHSKYGSRVPAPTSKYGSRVQGTGEAECRR